MGLNKNKIFGYTALILMLLGTGLILLGVFMYKEYTIGFTVMGLGFNATAWAFNALRGRI
ncbi:MAG: hypothetical protein CMC79_01355 [Flavobacteriaceae bacterium]|nr:hypothetical protein [Flavobacteriaceae bacterium]|tara:strand:- start:79 stop:258 length:180 start_codon:yes stop_codon:yes gene_type:complete